jgi:hypothetical protein
MSMASVASGITGAIHRVRFGIIGLYSLAFLVTVGTIAARRHFWYDEAFSLSIAGLPDSRAIWLALAGGAENQPPLNFWLVHAAIALPVPLELAARLPALISFWLMSLCLYRIVARETEPLYGLMAMAVPLLTPAVYFAYEARPYAPLLLVTAAAVLLWQMVRAGDHRSWTVPLWSLTLTAAVYLHYYGLFIFIPFVVVEAVRGLREGQWDRPLWMGFVAAGLALVPLAPFVITTGAFNTMFDDPSLASVQLLYGRLLGVPSALFLTLTLISQVRGSATPPAEAGRSMPWVLLTRDGALLLATFFTIPMLGFVLARLVTNAWADRYFLFVVVACAIGFALLVFRRWHTRPAFILACAVALSVMAALEVRHHYQAPSYRAGASLDVGAAVRSLGALPEGSEPIALTGMLYLAVSHYSSPTLRHRLVFLVDDPADHFSVAAKRLAPVRPMPMTDLDGLSQQRRPFYLYKPSTNQMRRLQRLALHADYISDDWYLVSARPRTP